MSSKPPRVIPIHPEPPSSLTAEQHSAVLAACARLKDLPGALMPILHAVQEALGYVPKDAVPVMARELNLSLAEVHGVLSFYHYFRKEPPRPARGSPVPCRGLPGLARSCSKRMPRKPWALDFHGTTADGRFTLEPVYCLGKLRAGSVDHESTTSCRAAVSTQRFDALMHTCRSQGVHAKDGR